MAQDGTALPPKPKSFTQDDLNAELARAREKFDAKLAKLRKEVEDRDVIISAARERIAELEPALEAERASHVATAASHRKFRLELDVDTALSARNVMPGKGKQHAAHFFQAEFELRTDDAGAIVGATRRVDGKTFDSAAEAVEAFQKENGHLFVYKPPVGGGTVPPWSNRSLDAWRARNDPAYRASLDPTPENPVDLINRGLKAPADSH